jgi:hypothetical protein
MEESFISKLMIYQKIVQEIRKAKITVAPYCAPLLQDRHLLDFYFLEDNARQLGAKAQRREKSTTRQKPSDLRYDDGGNRKWVASTGLYCIFLSSNLPVFSSLFPFHQLGAPVPVAPLLRRF